MSAKPTAVVLLSGGLDSATCLALAQSEGFDLLALSFRYGQRHEIELDAARRLAGDAGVREHLVIEINLRVFGESALTDDFDVPKNRCATNDDEIPITYVPARNTIFLSYALALAEVRGAADIFIGVNALDYSGYPDCRPEYVAAFQKMAALATRAGVSGNPPTIHAPLLHWSKERIIRRGLELGVDYARTSSCYDPDASGRACGCCDSCRIRLAAFEQVGIADPAPYR